VWATVTTLRFAALLSFAHTITVELDTRVVERAVQVT
jgi:hypothetical protein